VLAVANWESAANNGVAEQARKQACPFSLEMGMAGGKLEALTAAAPARQAAPLLAPDASEPVIVTRGLSKQYGSLTALDDCSLEVPRGTVFGLLGPNGAGKTTLLRLWMGFLRPTRGSAAILGHDCYRDYLQVHRRVAYMPGDARLPRHMTGRQVLDFFARLRTGRPADTALQIAQRLDLDLRRRVAWMSTGMRQKLALTVTLASPAEVVILDEPTSNLDPTIRTEVLHLVCESRQSGQTVVFSSHVLSETESVCQQVAILRSGRLVHRQCIEQLRRQHRVEARLDGTLLQVPAELKSQLRIQHDPRSGKLRIDTHGDLGPLLGWLGTLGLSEVSIQPVGLQTVYERYHPAGAGSELAWRESP
jgi:ABC-2 type transport system ATP-binding protein